MLAQQGPPDGQRGRTEDVKFAACWPGAAGKHDEEDDMVAAHFLEGGDLLFIAFWPAWHG